MKVSPGFYYFSIIVMSVLTTVEILHYAKQTVRDSSRFGINKQILCGVINAILLPALLTLEGMWVPLTLLFGCPIIILLELSIFTKDDLYSYGCIYIKLAMNFMAIFWMVTAMSDIFHDPIESSRENFIIAIFLSGLWSLLLACHKKYPMEELRIMIHDRNKGKLFFTYVLICDIFLGMSTILLSPILHVSMLDGRVRVIVMAELFLKTLVIFSFGYVLLFLQTKELRERQEHLEVKMNLENEKLFRDTIQRKGMMNLIVNLADSTIKDGRDYFINSDKISKMTFEGVVHYLAERIVHPDDREEFIKTNTRESVLEKLEENPYYSHTIRVNPKEVLMELKIAPSVAAVYRESEKSWVWVKIDYIYTKDRRTGDISLFAVVFDVDEDMNLKEELHISATTDALTGLLNRSVMQDLLEKALRRHHGRGTLLLLDVDNFKLVNDKMGHPMGDKVLIQYADILQKLFRRGDLVGRLGGDEFSVFMPAITDRRVVEERVRELNRSCQINYETKEGVRVSVSASIGIVISDADDDYESLYKKADEALYQSKRAGKNSYYFYE